MIDADVGHQCNCCCRNSCNNPRTRPHTVGDITAAARIIAEQNHPNTIDNIRVIIVIVTYYQYIHMRLRIHPQQCG